MTIPLSAEDSRITVTRLNKQHAHLQVAQENRLLFIIIGNGVYKKARKILL